MQSRSHRPFGWLDDREMSAWDIDAAEAAYRRRQERDPDEADDDFVEEKMQREDEPHSTDP